MKFETEFGLGEICVYGEVLRRGGATRSDMLVKVIFITIDQTGDITYTVEAISTVYGRQSFSTVGPNLTGDPDYDQDAGGYPAEDHGQ